ncbi:MAG: beta-mannosidase [Bacteroidales bacterium]|nr:beta-mannosidase [Bacteroidales bacterium]
MKIMLCFILSSVLLYSGFLQAQGVNTLADKKATTETQQLYKKLISTTQKGIMFGHQDDLAYGIGWKYPSGQSDVFRILGDYPAVFGWDLGHIETGSAYNLDSVSFLQMQEFALTVHNMGGINQYSWHCNNPLTGGSSWDISDPGAVKSILPGNAKNILYTEWLDKLASFLKSLTDENGKPIPVLFRPFHELEGDWFWWGKAHCSSDEFKQLYIFTINYLLQIKEVHNIITVYSNADNFNSCEGFLDRYPGNNYVDMIGFDFYQSPKMKNDEFMALVKQKLSFLEEAARKTGKIPAITEMGYEQIPDSLWWTNVLWPTIKDFRLSYVLFWRNAANRPNHYYMPYPGHPSEKDFLKLYSFPETLFRKDLN